MGKKNFNYIHIIYNIINYLNEYAFCFINFISMYVMTILQPLMEFTMISFNISLELVQRVALFRNPYYARLAPTLDTGSVGTVGASNLRNIYDSVKDTVDIFINDYLLCESKIKEFKLNPYLP